MTGVRTSVVFSLLGLPLGVASFLYSIYKWMRKVDLQDKVVLITGASGGIGGACAEVFYEAGCKLILSGRNIKSLETLKEKLANRMGRNCHTPAIIGMDLEDLDNIPKRVAEALKLFGHIDIVINNAGMSCRGWACETSFDVDEKLMRVNYFGQVKVTKAILPHMMERKSGHIVVVSSIQGKLGIPERAAYVASKHALEGFFDSLRAELSLNNINVSVVSSYYVRTNFSCNAVCGDGSSYNKMDKNTANGLEPHYVANEILNCVRKRKEEHIIAPFHIHLAICVRVLTPWLFFKIMDRRAKKGALENSKNQ